MKKYTYDEHGFIRNKQGFIICQTFDKFGVDFSHAKQNGKLIVSLLSEYASQQLNPADIESLATEIHEQVHNGASISDVIELLNRR